MNIRSPSFPKGLSNLRSESEARGNVTMLDVIRAGAADTVKREPHPTRDMPTCKWSGVHRYGEVARENGNVIEACDFCGCRRAYPIGTSSRHAKIIEFPSSADGTGLK